MTGDLTERADARGSTGAARRVAVAWWGLPMYAARLIGAAVKATPPGARLDVLATDRGLARPEAQETAGGRVHWLEQNGTRSWAQLGLAVPDVLFVSGWGVPQLHRLDREAGANHARVVSLCDHRFSGSPLQWAGILRQRLKRVADAYDYVWVPGEAGRQYARRIGFKSRRIHGGVYCADDSVFHVRRPLRDRACRFVFIGQFIDRKNVRLLHEAFTRYAARHPADGAELHMYGSGHLDRELAAGSRVFIHGPAAPSVLADVLNDSRCLVLPSKKDNWGLVVHEAALTGCALLLSDAVGSIPELARPTNSVIVSPRDVEGFVQAFHRIATMTRQELDEAERVSVNLAGRYSVRKWAEKFWELAGNPINASRSNDSA